MNCITFQLSDFNNAAKPGLAMSQRMTKSALGSFYASSTAQGMRDHSNQQMARLQAQRGGTTYQSRPAPSRSSTPSSPASSFGGFSGSAPRPGSQRQPAHDPSRPGWSTMQGQTAWQRRYDASDAREKERMLGRLNMQANTIPEAQRAQFNQTADQLRQYAQSQDRGVPQGMVQYAPGVYASPTRETQAFNTRLRNTGRQTSGSRFSSRQTQFGQNRPYQQGQTASYGSQSTQARQPQQPAQQPTQQQSALQDWRNRYRDANQSGRVDMIENGQENWKRKYQNADAQGRKAMLTRLQELGTQFGGDERYRLNPIVGNLETWAADYDKQNPVQQPAQQPQPQPQQQPQQPKKPWQPPAWAVPRA